MSLSPIEKTFRRILMAIMPGRVTAGDDGGLVQKLQAKLGANILRDGLPRIAEYGFTSNPLPGADVLVVFAAGDHQGGVIVATADKRYRLKNLAPGEVALYDNQGRSVYLSDAGIVINGAASPVTVNTDGDFVVNAAQVVMNTSKLQVSGDIVDNNGSNPHSMAAMRSIYDTHTHGGIQTGGSNTGPPNQTE